MLLIINEDHVGQRIDNFLFSHLRGVPKTRVYRMIRKGEVRVDSRRIDASFKLQIGQKIRIPPVRIPTRPSYDELDDENSIDFLEIEKKIEIIDETNGLLIVNKAEGLAVHGGSGKSFGLIESLRKIKNRPGFGFFLNSRDVGEKNLRNLSPLRVYSNFLKTYFCVSGGSYVS